MVILILGLILLGSFSTAAFLMIQGVSWGMVALGYMGGGWAGLILGIVLLYLPSLLSGPCRRGLSLVLQKGQSRHGRFFGATGSRQTCPQLVSYLNDEADRYGHEFTARLGTTKTAVEGNPSLAASRISKGTWT